MGRDAVPRSHPLLTRVRRLLPALAALLLAPHCLRGADKDFAVEPVRSAPLFEATRAAGEIYRLGDQRGKVVLLSFGYTACPDVCPTTLSQLSSLYARLGKRAEEVEVVFVTVDPDRDALQPLEDYVRTFHPRFTGLRLEGEALETLLSGYGVTASRRYPDAQRYRHHSFSGNVPYTVDHTGAYFVIDRRGALRLRLPYDVPVEQLQARVERLLDEPSLHVEHAQARLTPARVGAVYLTLVNSTPRDDRLVAVESTSAERVEMHEVMAQGEFLQMIPRPDGFTVPAGGRIELRPGGKHLMLYAVQASPSEATVELALHFERAGTLRMRVPISRAGKDTP